MKIQIWNSKASCIQSSLQKLEILLPLLYCRALLAIINTSNEDTGKYGIWVDIHRQLLVKKVSEILHSCFNVLFCWAYSGFFFQTFLKKGMFFFSFNKECFKYSKNDKLNDKFLSHYYIL